MLQAFFSAPNGSRRFERHQPEHVQKVRVHSLKMELNTKNKTLRLDKWLNISCILKTRSQATKSCDTGRIKVNDQVAKPSKLIKIGDTISVKYKTHRRTFDVLAISTKSISHQEARLLYREHELSPEEQEALDIQKELFRAGAKFQPKYKGRPTKRERRDLEKFKDKLGE